MPAEFPCGNNSDEFGENLSVTDAETFAFRISGHKTVQSRNFMQFFRTQKRVITEKWAKIAPESVEFSIPSRPLGSRSDLLPPSLNNNYGSFEVDTIVT